MDSPKSVELSIPQVRDIATKIQQFKGKPPERVVPRKIIESIKALPPMPETDRFRADEEAAQAVMAAAVSDEEKAHAEEGILKTRKEFNAALQEWMQKPVFLPLDRNEKDFVWGLFVKEFHSEITTMREDEIETIARAIGKAGSMEDLFADAIDEAEKAEKEEQPAEPVKPALVP